MYTGRTDYIRMFGLPQNKTEVGEKKTGHDYVVDSPKVDATCETAGKTEVKKCKTAVIQ